MIAMVLCLWIPAAARPDLHDVRRAIREKNLKWRAGSNPISCLSRAEFAAMIGHRDEPVEWIADETGARIFNRYRIMSSKRWREHSRIEESASPPAQLDWRDVEGANWVTSVKDQGGCGSCWDFGAIAAWESRILLARGNPAADVDKSEQYVLSCSHGTCAGWSNAGAAGFIFVQGCPDEIYFPYGDPYDLQPCGNVVPGWEESVEHLSSGAYLNGAGVPDAGQVETIKNALLDGPVVSTMLVWDDFRSYAGGIYEYATGDSIGGHCILLVGWDDTSSPPCWIGKNSWGTGWGESGFFRIAIGETRSEIGRYSYEITHHESVNEMELCVEDTISSTRYGSSSPGTRYGGVEFTVTSPGRTSAVWTRFVESQMNYAVRLYDGISGGVPGALLSELSGSFTNIIGWERINLSPAVAVDQNQELFVSVQYSNAAYGIPLESLESSDNSDRSWYSNNGLTFAHFTSYGDICIRAVIDTTPPAPVQDATLLIAAGDLTLNWSEVTTDSSGKPTFMDRYIVYRDSEPHFQPSPGDSLCRPCACEFTDVGVLGDPSTNYYYRLAALDRFGRASELSSPMGEFDFSLEPGESEISFCYNDVCPVFADPGLDDADDLADHIGGVYAVYKWDADAQSWIYWLPDYALGTNFSVQTGHPYQVSLKASASDVVSFTGIMPDRGSVVFDLVPGESAVSFKYNYIALPFDKYGIADADSLAKDIGGVYAIYKWDTGSQSWIYWLPDYSLGTNFEVRPGYCYLVSLKDSAPAQWPQEPPQGFRRSGVIAQIGALHLRAPAGGGNPDILF